MVGKRTWEMQSQTCPTTELHSSFQNFRPRSLRGAQPSYFSLNFWAIKEEELQEHLKLPRVSTERGQTTQFTDFYYNLDFTTGYYSSNWVVTNYNFHSWLCSLFTNWALFLSDLAQVQQPELLPSGLELEKSKSTLPRPQQTEILYVFRKILCGCYPMIKWNKTTAPAEFWQQTVLVLLSKI